MPLLITLCAFALASCGSSNSPASSGIVNAIGAENEYANVIFQIGGQHVHVSAILNNPNTDPHTFESSPSVANEVSSAELIVQNGVGYDDWMNKIESASPSSSRRVITVANLLGLPSNTANPHLWYAPNTMPAVAREIANDLSTLLPNDRAYFQANLSTFQASLQPWTSAIAAFKAAYSGTPVAVTEPVADYLLQAMGADIVTPFAFQADIMNGVDPPPQDISNFQTVLSGRQVKVFCYNQQVVDTLTTSLRTTAEGAGVPLVGVYETMPVPGYNYQSWMLAEVQDIQKAVASGVSTEHL